MKKSRAIYGRPLIAVRSVDGLKNIDGPSPDSEAYEVPGAEYGEVFVKREFFIGENCVEYKEILNSDNVDWSEVDLSELGYLPALSLPLTAEAVPSATVILDQVEEEEGAKPERAVMDGLAKPTNRLS
ncbi:chitinase [Colletotrichum tofieldiae]|nr:chitinase [Colletotrichum tofieldiae]